MNPDRSELSPEPESSLQHRIETFMKQYVEEGRWECILLFSSDGLLMAKSGTSGIYGEDQLLEFAFSLVRAVNLLGGDLPVREILIRGQEHKILVFRYFKAWDEYMVLAVVVPGKKGYRKALTDVVKQIQRIH
jgi:hypothetical protein